MPRRSELTVAQRRDAVVALLRREEPATQLARRFNVSEQTLYRWRDEFLAAGEAALAHGKNGASAQARANQELRAQLDERDLVIGELTVANRLLKNSRARRVDRGAACRRRSRADPGREAATNPRADGPGRGHKQLVSSGRG